MALAAKAGTAGRYAARFAPAKAGLYEVSVAADIDGAGLGEAAVGFEVGKEDMEMRRLDLDEDTLRTLAVESGGRYMPLVDFPSFASQLAATGTVEKTVEFVNLRQKRILYPLFLLFVALATVEWFWRKRSQLP